MRAMQLKLTSFPKAFASLPNNSFISVPTRSGAGFSMTGNRISNGRGNGCIGRANNGLISENIILDMAYDGVVIGPSISDREGSFSSNVAVRLESLMLTQSIVTVGMTSDSILVDMSDGRHDPHGCLSMG